MAGLYGTLGKDYFVKQLAFDFFQDWLSEAKSLIREVKKKEPQASDRPLHPAKEPSAGKIDFELTPVVNYRLERAKRKSVGFIIDERGLTVRAPCWVSVAEIKKRAGFKRNSRNLSVGKKKSGCKVCALWTAHSCRI